MGRLYLGRDPEMDRLVAIKLLREGFDTRELRERFSREARTVSALRHPNIVTIFETGTHEGQPSIVMEYIQGETLSQIIRRGVGRRERASLASGVRRSRLLIGTAGALVVGSALAVWHWTEPVATPRDPSSTAITPVMPTSSTPGPSTTVPPATPAPSTTDGTSETRKTTGADQRPNPRAVPATPAVSPTTRALTPRVPDARLRTPIETPVFNSPTSPRTASPEPTPERPSVQSAPSPAPASSIALIPPTVLG